MDLVYQFYIGAEPKKVWEALVSEEGVRQIFYGCTLRSSFQVGDDYAYVGPGTDGDETVHVYGKWLAFEPYKLMSSTEHPGPSYNEQHETLETRVTITLEEVGASTKLTLVNDNWPEQHPSYENTKNSWPILLSNVKSYVETGKILDLGW